MIAAEVDGPVRILTGIGAYTAKIYFIFGLILCACRSDKVSIYESN
ncbi:hypothetical protein P4V43_00400 [Brevibacillus fortis]|nr:hypothetical protein [Brevibacillus fortis]